MDGFLRVPSKLADGLLGAGTVVLGLFAGLLLMELCGAIGRLALSAFSQAISSTVASPTAVAAAAIALFSVMPLALFGVLYFLVDRRVSDENLRILARILVTFGLLGSNIDSETIQESLPPAASVPYEAYSDWMGGSILIAVGLALAYMVVKWLVTDEVRSRATNGAPS